MINEKLLLEELLKRDSVKDKPCFSLYQSHKKAHIFTPSQFSVVNIHIRTKDKKILNSDRAKQQNSQGPEMIDSPIPIKQSKEKRTNFGPRSYYVPTFMSKSRTFMTRRIGV